MNQRPIKRNSEFPRVKYAPLLIAAVLAFIVFSCRSQDEKSEHPNVLFITIDGMRSDRVGPSAKKPMEMPVMDRLWTLGSVLTNTIAASPLRTPAYASIFTGTYPPVNGVRTSRTDELPDSAVTLAELLKAKGYKTGAIVSNVDALGRFGIDQGFDFYDDNMLQSIEDDGLPQPPWNKDVDARKVTSIAVQWIDEAEKEKKPWFMWVQYSDALAPTTPVFPFNELFPNNPLAAELAYIDANLGILTGKLSDMGIDKNTLVVITSSSGNPQGEHGESGNAYFAYMSTLRVPTMFYFPGKIPSGKEITQYVSSTDLMPTILGLTGIKKPGRLDGLDLSKTLIKQKPMPQREIIYSENMFLNAWHNWVPVVSAINGNYHLIVMQSSELYDAASDVNEENNIAGQNSAKVEEMRNQLSDALDKMKKRRLKKIDEMENAEKEVLKNIAELKIVPIAESTSGTENLTKEQMLNLLAQYVSKDSGENENTQQNKLQEILNAYPNYPFALYLNAGELFKTGNMDEAFKTYGKAINSGFRFLKAASLMKISRILAMQNKFAEAEKIIKGVLKIVPENPGVYTDLGNILTKQKRFEEAETALQEALKIDPNYYKARYNLAALYVADARRIPAARVEIDKILNQNPNYVPAHFLGAKIAVAMDNPERARLHLNKILELVPADSRFAGEAQAMLNELNKLNVGDSEPQQPK